ncbi:Ig-like domain-containing protein [Lachnospiraceae bacterium 66-29]
MKASWKRRISVLLCLLLTLPAVVGAFPQAKLEVQAAKIVQLRNIYEGKTYEVARNIKNFYLGDCISVWAGGGDDLCLSMRSGAKYKSSNPSIVKINASTGLVIPRKEGSAKITATYKGVSITFTIRVVSSFEKDEYDYGYSTYSWHSANSIAQDLYAYYRCYFLSLSRW